MKTLDKAKLGDKVLIEGTITSKNDIGSRFIKFDEYVGYWFAYDQPLVDIIPPPWTPKIDDKVKYVTGTTTYTLRGFVDGRAVIKSASGNYYTAEKGQLVSAVENS